MPGSPEPDINLTTKPSDREEQHVQGAEDDQGLCKNMVIEKSEERLSDEVKVRKRERERCAKDPLNQTMDLEDSFFMMARKQSERLISKSSDWKGALKSLRKEQTLHNVRLCVPGKKD